MGRFTWQKNWYWWLGLILLLSFHFWFPIQPPGPRHDTYGAEGEGKKAFYMLVESQPEVSTRRISTSLPTHLNRLNDRYQYEDVVCILGPERMLSEKEWQPVLDWVSQGGSLVVAARLTSPEFKIPELNIEVKKKSFESDWPGTRLVDSENLIWDSFAENGIEFPFPQRDVNLRIEDRELVEKLIDLKNS